jgi:protein Mpv17
MPWFATARALLPATVAGVSFAWTVIISVMRGALDSGKVAAAAPTTAQLEDATATVAAAATTADAVEQPAVAAVQVSQATAEPAAAAPVHAPVIAAGEVQRSQAAAGLKALVVPRATAHAEAAT